MSNRAFSKAVLEKLKTQERARLENDLKNSKKPRLRYSNTHQKFSLFRSTFRADLIDFLWIIGVLIVHSLTSINLYALLVLGLLVRLAFILRSLNRPRRDPSK